MKRYASSRVPRAAAAAVALLVLASTALASAARPGSFGAPCARPTYVASLGWACTGADGLYRVAFDDGVVRVSHGPDFVPIAQHLSWQMDLVKRRNPDCVTSARSQYHLKVIYAYAQDAPNRYAEMRPELVDIMRTVNGFLYKESKSTGRPLDYRVACARDGSILIDSVRLQLTKGRTGIPAQLLDYNNIVNEVRKAGYTNPFAKYWIWYDGMSPLPGVGGIASMVDDDRLAADNGNNFGPMYGVFYGITGGFGATVMMHEGSHILGAVMPGSPNSSGSFHCNDGDDVMCYQDGGPNSNGYNERACPTAMKFDCNKNDYFNPKPKAGSWLATHWNLGSPLNRFFAGCQYATGLVQAAAGGQALDEAVRAQIPQWSDVAARTVKISKGCRGRYFALYSAISLQPSAIDKAEGNVPGHDLSMGVPVGDHIIGGGRPEDSIVNRVPVDFDVCYFAGSKLLSCRSEVGTDFGKVPAKATKARVVAKAAANASFILSIV